MVEFAVYCICAARCFALRFVTATGFACLLRKLAALHGSENGSRIFK